MGKHSRRKKKSGMKKGQQDETNDTTSSSLLNQIRHSNPETRHAALAGLMNTIFATDSSSTSNNNSKKIQIDILQAIRERVMDKDLECAQLAAACLSNYLEQEQQENNNNKERKIITSSWTVVFLQRLNECITEIEEKKSSAENNNNNPSVLKREKRLWAMIMQCLSAICNLVEMNHKALTQFFTTTNNENTNNNINSIASLLSVLMVGTQQFEKNKNNKTNDLAAATTTDTILYFNEKSLIYAAQALHSALDDNMDLMKQCTATTNFWNVIRQTCTNSSLPLSCRLHCAGCIVTAWNLSTSEDDAVATILLSAVTEDVNPLLCTILDHYTTASLSNTNSNDDLLNNIRSAQQKLKTEEADNVLETEIIRKVTERKESSRQIARRQKKAQQQKKEKEKAKQEQGEDTPMEEEEDNNEDEGASNNKKVQSNDKDAREAFELAKSEWYKKQAPLELALEVLANLTGLRMTPLLDEDDNDIVMDEDWGPEQEKMLLEEGEGDTTSLSPLDISLINTIVQSRIPNQLMTVLKILCSNSTNNNSTTETADKVVPDTIQDSLQELRSKCGACIGNCMGEHFAGSSWIATVEGNENNDNTSVVVVGLLQQLRTVLVESNGNHNIANAIAAGLRSHSIIREQCQPDDLTVFIQFASSSSCQREAIEILGILCSCETHNEEVNRNVCLTLLSIETKENVEIQNEIFNALMDIYGNDGCHPAVFESLNVLNYFQRITPKFKHMIQQRQQQRDSNTEEEDQVVLVEQFKETLLNASRFISYKKGQL